MRIVITMIACAVLCSGCATITRGRTQTWSVQTEPAGATVKLSSGEQCTTPCSMEKRRKDPFQVTIDLTGYHQVVTQVISGVKGGGVAGVAGNVLIGGIIGIGVDLATGAGLDLMPNPLMVKMVPVGMAAPAAGGYISAPAAEPATGDATGDGRSVRLSNYGPAAKTEFARMHCDTGFKLVSVADGNETYQATCADGKNQLLACDGVSCRPTK